MDDILHRALLYDFYGELLTERQREIYEQFIQEDLSLGEIAENAGISRQGVHDLVRRCGRILQGYEDKLHLLERFLNIKEKIYKLNGLLDGGPEEDRAAGDGLAGRNAEIRRILAEIIEEL